MGPGSAATVAAPRRRLPTGLLIALFGLVLTAAAWLDVLNRQANDRAIEIERIHDENSALARAFEEHVRRVLKTADSALLFLQEDYAAHGRVTAGMTDFVDRAKRDPILTQISLADARGDLQLSAVKHRGTINIAQREHFQVHAARSDAGLFVGKPVITKVSGMWSFFLSRRLSRPDGSFAGIVSVGIDPAYFSQYYGDPDLGRDRAILLVGRDGIVRARRFQNQTEIGQDLHTSPLFTALPRAPVGHYEVVGVIDGLRRFASYRALADYPLVVVVSDLKNIALAPFERRAASSRLAALIFTGFVAAFCLALYAVERRAQRRDLELAAELAERRRAEAALRENQDLFAAFLDHVPAAVFVQDLQGTVLYSNQAYRELPEREAVGRHARVLLAPAGDGAAGPPPALRGHSVAIDEPVGDGAGGARIFETRMFVVDRAGKEPLLGCVSVDVTGRRNAEAERLTFERRMQQIQKLESLGVLAGGIAHDFNNLLMVILGNTDLAFARTPPESPLRPLLANIETTAQRAADLTNQMLAYSGKGRFTVESINLSRLVEELGHLLATVLSKRAAVAYRLDPDLPAVDADATQLRQVVMNLITNASDALGGHEGTIAIATRVEEIALDAPKPGVMDHHLPPGRYAAIEVSDSGCGMDAGTLGRIFDPFFTTKQAGRGLGLASVLGIVRGHRGGIRVQSAPGRGTTFSVLLPVATRAEEAAAGECPLAGRPPQATRSRVLVVDDEADVRRTAQAMLEEVGFEVVAAADGAEGVEVFVAQRGRLGAVLLDMTMPRMGGEEAFRQMHRIDPAVPVILMSGFDEQEAVARLEGAGLAGFIRKPYRLSALVAKLREAIPGGAAPPP